MRRSTTWTEWRPPARTPAQLILRIDEDMKTYMKEQGVAIEAETMAGKRQKMAKEFFKERPRGPGELFDGLGEESFKLVSPPSHPSTKKSTTSRSGTARSA
jgi:hypothetical protein